MSRPIRQKRWGLRSMAYLGLAAGSIIVSNWMRMTGNTDVILLTFIGTVVGPGRRGRLAAARRASAPGAAKPSPAQRIHGQLATPTARNWAVTPGRRVRLPLDQERHQRRDGERCEW